MKRLANITTYTGIINYGAVQKGTNAPANADAQLQTETFRKLTASTGITPITIIDLFYSKSDTNGTYPRIWDVHNRTALTNTGQLFTRDLKQAGR